MLCCDKSKSEEPLDDMTPTTGHYCNMVDIPVITAQPSSPILHPPAVHSPRISLLPNNTILVAMYDFNAIEAGDVTFKRGDRLILIDNKIESDWWLVQHLTNHTQGLIPSNYVAEEMSIESEDWFFCNTSRREAEKYLLESPTTHGSFLIRNSEQDPNGFSLSIKINSDVEEGYLVCHYKIKTSENSLGYYIFTSDTYPTLRMLVEAHTKSDLGLCCLLTVACARPKPELWNLSSSMKDHWEVERSEVEFKKELGSGNFGKVWLGSWKEKIVAVKTLKPGTMSSESFLEEATIMKKFRHRNIVALYAVCSKSEPILIIQEFLEKGSLLAFLRSDAGRSLDLIDLVYISVQLASGLLYLEQQCLIHRDIAARNILVGEHNTVKICDFGLARLIENEDYFTKTGKALPVKWTAPEGLLCRKFTIKSDVWSYGILLMEIFTYGEVPYPGMTCSQVINALKEGYRMPKPSNTSLPNKIYEVMRKCWEENPNHRPGFGTLLLFFEDLYDTLEDLTN